MPNRIVCSSGIAESDVEEGKMADLDGDDPRLLALLVCLDSGALACPFPFPLANTSISPASDSTLPKVGLKELLAP